MKKINTTKWKKYKLTDLFEITGSKTTPKQKLDLTDDGKYPYVTTAASNNGVAGYSDVFTDEGNVLTVDSAVIGTCLYQSKNFTASDHVEKLIPKFETEQVKMTECIALFLVTVINANAKLFNYAYNEKRSQKALEKEEIPLPTKNNKPDWEYMEKYVKQIQIIQRKKLDKELYLYL